MNWEKIVRPEVQAFIPYDAHQVPYRIKLDANESPYDLPASARRRLSEWLLAGPGLNLYPDTAATELRNKLGTLMAYPPENLIVGVGSDQLILTLCQTFAGKDDVVLVPAPSFSMYKVAAVIGGAETRSYALREENDYLFEADTAIAAAKSCGAKMMFICTPNNPTGAAVPAAEIEKVVRALPDTVVVVDEAYNEFSGQSVLRMTESFDNMIVLRTFSKALGLAGARIGYAAACPELLRQLERVKPPYNINSLSMKAAVFALDEADILRNYVTGIVRQRENLREGLEAMGLKVYPSDANFLLVRVTAAEAIREALEHAGVLVRAFGPGPLEQCLRISVGTSDEIQELLMLLKTML